MKLISLRIENFGGLKDFTCLFKDGVNTVVRENGWGKSTLAAFIRVMFYGFDNEGKRSDLENERRKYLPWQGGVYGGTIVFEAKGKTYRIERTFEEKRGGGGTFAIYDTKTNLETKDYSENIGEELFGIDADSFERTVFIGQQDCETTATSAINAKIGNIADNTADMGQYEAVQARLKREADSLTPSRKTGAAARLKDDIASKEAMISKKTVSEKHSEEIAAQIKRLLEVKAENAKRLEKTRDEMNRLSVLKDIKEKKGEYERLKNECRKARSRQEELLEYFGGRTPDEDELREMNDKAGRLSSYDQIMKDFRLNENEKKDEERIYDEYPDGFPEDQETAKLLSLYNESRAKKNALITKEANLSLMSDMKEKEKADALAAGHRDFVMGIVFLAASLVFFAAGLFMLSNQKTIAYILFAVTAIVAGAGIFKLPSKNDNTGSDEDETVIKLREDIESDQSFIEKTDEAVDAFLKKLSKERPEDGDLGAIFEKVKADRQKSYEYSRRREKFDEAHGSRDEIVKDINRYLASFGKAETTNPSESLGEIKEKTRQLKEAQEDLLKKQEDLDRFSSQNDTERLNEETGETEGSVEELNGRIDALLNENAELDEKLKVYREELEENDEELADMEMMEEQLLSMKERLDELLYRYDIICDTRDYLEKAKNSFAAKYMEPIKRAFDKYYGVLSCNDGREYELDANLNIRHINRGVSRDTALLSDGYRDLVGLCRRMAMIEAMYREETPFLILDDPFVNLDNDRVKGGVNVLKRISDNYQIIYFTCHDSRAV